MKVVFYCNYLNHHQVLIADELYRLLGDDYRFVATLPRNEKELKGGLDYSLRPYCLLAGESEVARGEAMQLAREAEVCVFGACSQEYAVERARQKECGLSFEMGERWLKRGWVNVLSPRFLKWWMNYMCYFHRRPFYKLCSSAFAAADDRKVFAYRGRHYKWGYFTAVDEEYKVEALGLGVSTLEITPHIMWCSRFLKLKHPELPIHMAAGLKSKGYRFILDMYGSGEEEASTKQLVHELGVEDVVHFHGALPNAEILQAMRQHDIFLFTSDRYEGWGAVANEAMANGCVLVASDAIGSTPYLIKEGVNGFSFASESVDALTERVEWLINHPEQMRSMQREACRTMQEVWSPAKATSALLQLIEDLQHGRGCSIINGPCSKA